ncbi:DUF1822 family protein [Acaryochloris marina S15]|nr:DUF1822 family protein [Acaryochloris marina S15]
MLPLMSDSLALPITLTARQIAQGFGQQQSTPEKCQQVYLNTLAVLAVKEYLALMEIPCNLEASDSWNPVVRLCADVADLLIPGMGSLECRPILPGTPTCLLPPEVWSDRVGYLVVVIDDQQRRARILGFTPTAQAGQIAIEHLQPLESLLAHISEFMLVDTKPPTFVQTDLGQWLQGIFNQSWQVVEDLLQPSTREPAFHFRSAATTSTVELDDDAVQIKRAKLVKFKNDAEEIPLVLIMNLLQTETYSQRMLCVQLRPAGQCTSLPANLVLRVLDNQHNTFLEAQSRQADNYLQLEFSGLPGEQFHLDLEQGNHILTETFII